MCARKLHSGFIKKSLCYMLPPFPKDHTSYALKHLHGTTVSQLPSKILIQPVASLASIEGVQARRSDRQQIDNKGVVSVLRIA